MLLEDLYKVLPSDYMTNVYLENTLVWRGITWVFLYDKVYTRFRTYAVMKFETDYYNEEVTITISRR